MTRLELVQRLALEVGASGAITTTIATQGEALRLVTWIDQAWQELQTKAPDWQWMRKSALLGDGASFTTVAADYDYPLGTGAGFVGVEAADFGMWDPYSFRLRTTSLGVQDEAPLSALSYDSWRNGYMMGAQQTVTTRPVVMAIGPGDTIVLGPPPTAGYTVTGDYFRAPLVMAANGDTPTGLAVQFQMLIVYIAMTYYAGYESAPEVLSRAQAGYGPLMRQLQTIQAQPVGIAGPLA